MFYPEEKKYMSPSALDNWKNSKSSFVKSYFEKDKTPETASMKAGTRIHRLIEAGMIEAKHVFDKSEEEIYIPVKDEIDFMGRPDSRTSEAVDGVAYFVDYKSGKANDWKDKLPKDIKMRATAWLVWKATGEPQKVVGYIEYIATTWDPTTKEIVPIEGIPTESIEQVYTADELKDFTTVISKAIDDVNEFYEKWKESTDAFVSEKDCDRYAELQAQMDVIELEMGEIKERIMSQMEFGGLLNHKTPIGTFYITEKKTYEYPSSLKVNYLDMGLVLDDAEEIATCVKTAKKNYELINEPKTTSKSIGFRKAKE